jgi:hypothetical protein
MQGTVILRSLGVFSLAALLAACNTNTRSSAGQTPVPSNTTLAQANSTAAPDQTLSQGPGDKYFASASADTKGVLFTVWFNGRPVNKVFPAGSNVDVTQDMKGHANVVAVQWKRTQKDGKGTLTIRSPQKTILTAKVTASSPPTGQLSKTFIAPQVPVGRPSTGP